MSRPASCYPIHPRAVKLGRTDNGVGPKTPGEVEIWADGEKIVSVTGNLGAKRLIGDSLNLRRPYFKFGVYRKKVPETFRFSFDEFAHVAKRADLPKVCAKP